MMSSSDLDFSPLGTGESAQQLSRPSLSYWQDAWLRLKANRRALFSLFLVIALLLFTPVGPWLWRADPAVQDLDQISQPPGVDRSALIVEPYQPWSVGEVAGSGLRLAEPATTQAVRLVWEALPDAHGHRGFFSGEAIDIAEQQSDLFLERQRLRDAGEAEVDVLGHFEDAVRTRGVDVG